MWVSMKLISSRKWLIEAKINGGFRKFDDRSLAMELNRQLIEKVESNRADIKSIFKHL